MYQPVIPFYPSIVSPGVISPSSSTSSSSGGAEWKSFPDKLDIYVYQGDDVQIPLFFQNPNEDFDLSSGWEWAAQVRLRHRYWATKVYDFSIGSEYIQPDDPTNGTGFGMTKVTLFLPRLLNRYIGRYAWDLRSTSAYDGPVFPQPPDVEDDEWPPTDQIKTWLYGRVIIVPRVTDTDVLPDGSADNGDAVVVTPQGWVIGPNGRVP